MKLLITHVKLPKAEQLLLADSQRMNLINSDNFDGLSTMQIKNKLSLYKKDVSSFNHLLVTADSRLLMFVDDNIFKTGDIMVRKITGEIVPIQKATERKLRIGHNLMKLYDAGEFGGRG